MSVFDRFLNPTWHKLSSLQPQEMFEVSIIVAMHGFARKFLREEFVAPFEKVCDPQAQAKLLKGPFGPLLQETQKLWPLREEIRERLIDEIEIGFLTCVKGRPIGNLCNGLRPCRYQAGEEIPLDSPESYLNLRFAP